MIKKVPAVALLALLAWFVPVHAQVRQPDSGRKTATVVSLKKHMMPADFIGGVINDVIPQPQKYIYDVEIRLDCNLYVGRYESSINQIPSIFNLNHAVNVRTDGDLMMLSSPQGGAILTTAIVSYERANSCPATE
jgi:hypothetical protein